MTGTALGQSSTRGRHWAAVFAAGWLLALATHTSGLVNPVHCDYSTWLRVAQDWNAGQTLYGETFDNKNPTVFLVVGLLGWSNPAVSLYFAETLFAAFTASILFLALRRTAPRAALLAPMLLIAWSGTATTFVQGQTTETMALWCDVLAISCAVLAVRNASLGLVAVSGIFAFLAFSARIPCVIHIVAYWPIITRTNRRHGRRRTIQLMGVFAASFLGALLALYLHGQFDGYWDRFVDVTQYNLQYGAVDRIPMSASLLGTVKVLARIELANPLMVLLAVLSLPVLIRPTGKRPAGGRFWTAIAFTWLIAAVVGAYPGGRHYLHYYHTLWAPLSLIAALGLSEFSKNPKTRPAARSLIRAVAITVVGLAVLQNAYGIGKWASNRHTAADRQQPVIEAAEYLQQLTDADTPVALDLWLDNAELYWRVRRESGTFPIPQVLPGPKLKEWSKYVLENNVPILVVGPSFDARETDVEDFHRLKRSLGSEYVKIRQIGQVRFFARRGSRFDKSNRPLGKR